MYMYVFLCARVRALLFVNCCLRVRAQAMEEQVSFVIALPPNPGGAGPAGAAAAAARLETVRARCMEMVSQIVGDHVWQVRACGRALHGLLYTHARTHTHKLA